MAHCDARLSDATNTMSPANVNFSKVVSTLGNNGALGCTSDTHVVACTSKANSPQNSYLVVYDADGNRIWDDGGQLGSSANGSAPLLGSDGTLIAVDAKTILRANPTTNTILWKSQKPDGGVPISPVLVGARQSMVLLATNSSPMAGQGAEVSVWDSATGALLAHQALVDPVTGIRYVTVNTVAVRGNRAYIVTNAENDDTDGRLYAVDVCEAADCGAPGTLSIKWHFDFVGPSQASPLLIGSRLFFDGTPPPARGRFMAVDDLGTAPALVWSKVFSTRFVSAAAQDPRGGLWVYPLGSTHLFRLNQGNGNIDQSIILGSVLGIAPDYEPASCVSVSSSTAGAVVLTFGTFLRAQAASTPSFVAAVDVSSSSAGTALWKYQVAALSTNNRTGGQFPIAISPTGKRRVAFVGISRSTFFIGEP